MHFWYWGFDKPDLTLETEILDLSQEIRPDLVIFGIYGVDYPRKDTLHDKNCILKYQNPMES